MKTHAGTLTDEAGMDVRDEVALVMSRMVLEADPGSHVTLTIRAAAGTSSERLGFAYSSPAARTHAEVTFRAGQIHAARGEGKAPEGPPLDVLLFWLGDTQERQRLEILAAGDAIPATLAPKKERTQGEPAGVLAKRIEKVVAALNAAVARNAEDQERMENPNAVYINLLMGGIAKPTPAQIVYIYGGATALLAAVADSAPGEFVRAAEPRAALSLDAQVKPDAERDELRQCAIDGLAREDRLMASLAAVKVERNAMREAGRYMVRVADYMRKDPFYRGSKETDRVFLMAEMSSPIRDEDAARAALSLDASPKREAEPAPITSSEILARAGADLSEPFDRGPFPPEMRMTPQGDTHAADSGSTNAGDGTDCAASKDEAAQDQRDGRDAPKEAKP